MPEKQNYKVSDPCTRLDLSRFKYYCFPLQKFIYILYVQEVLTHLIKELTIKNASRLLGYAVWLDVNGKNPKFLLKYTIFIK